MNTISKQTIAQTGENVAAQYLVSHGYKVIYRNYRQPCGEIDLIVEKNQHLIFTEVKTRTSHSIAAALDSVSYKKQKRITKTAQLYINQNPVFANHIFRFDVVVVFYFPKTDTYSVQHFEDAFLPIIEE